MIRIQVCCYENSERLEFTSANASGAASAATQADDLFYSGYIPGSIPKGRSQTAISLDFAIGCDAHESSQQSDLHTRSVSEENLQGNACCAYQSTTSNSAPQTTLSRHVVSEEPNVFSYLEGESTFDLVGGEAILAHESTNKLPGIDVFDGASADMYPELTQFNFAYQAVFAKNERKT